MVEATDTTILLSELQELRADDQAEPRIISVHTQPAAVLVPLPLFDAVADKIDAPVLRHLVEATDTTILLRELQELRADDQAEPRIISVHTQPAAVLVPLPLFDALANEIDAVMSRPELLRRLAAERAAGGPMCGTVAELAAAADVDASSLE